MANLYINIRVVLKIKSFSFLSCQLIILFVLVDNCPVQKLILSCLINPCHTAIRVFPYKHIGENSDSLAHPAGDRARAL